MFSLVITTKDREFFLKRTLKSVLKSNKLPSDIIIVNDAGSSVDLSDLDFGLISVTVINNKKSFGANYCRNLGIKTALNEVVFLLDDDDVVTPDSFLNRYRIINKDPEIGLCFTGIKIVSSKSLDLVKRIVPPVQVENFYYSLLNDGNIIGSTSRVVLRKKYFYKAGTFDESLSCLQDYDLWIRMAKVCKIANDKEASVIYTVHESGKQTSSKFKNYENTGLVVFDKYKEDLYEFRLDRVFKSKLYLRCALSASSSSLRYKLYYACKSFILNPSLKSLALIFVPNFFLKKFFLFA